MLRVGGIYQLWQKWQTMSAQTGAFEKSCFQGMAVPSLCRPAKELQTSHSYRLSSYAGLRQIFQNGKQQKHYTRRSVTYREEALCRADQQAPW